MIDFKEIKNEIITKNNLYCLFVISIIFFLDRYTKLFILNNFTGNTYYLNNFINLDLVWNTGIGFGLLSSNSPFFYHSITILIILVIIFLFYSGIKSKFYDKISFSVIIGGALGNFYDRVIYNAVPDFIDLHYKNFHWFTFNIADIFITSGIIFFIVGGFLGKNKI